MELPHEKRFYFSDGSAAKNLNELKEKLEIISYSDFYHHVTDGRNDFANWVRYVLGDRHLADDLERVDSIVETVEILNDYLHPVVAKKHLDAQDDMQSRIEKEVGIEDFTEEPVEFARDETEFSRDETRDESLAEPAPLQEDLSTQDGLRDDFTVNSYKEHAAAVEEHLFAMNKENTKEMNEEMTGDENESAKKHRSAVEDDQPEEMSRHYRREAGERAEIESFHHDIGTLIVKDFIIGLIFGLVIGFLLARMITIF